jgi:hypothetical protein
MIRVILLFFSVTLIGIIVFGGNSFAQDDDCCPEEDKYGREEELLESEWDQQMYELNALKASLIGSLSLLDKDINNLKAKSSEIDRQLIEAEDNLYSCVGADRKTVADFRKKFDETEKKVNNKLGNCEDARKYYFDEIEASRIKCLPEFYNRFTAMKSKIESWCAETGKAGQYTVVKGDCLWRIAGKNEIYGNGNYWPKLWEANEEGVISAPRSTPKKISNPNLIYPGQVLKVPALSQEDLQKLNSLSYIMKVQKESDTMYKEAFKKNRPGSVTKEQIKKKAPTIKKDVRIDIKKDEKKPEIKK